MRGAVRNSVVSTSPFVRFWCMSAGNGEQRYYNASVGPLFCQVEPPSVQEARSHAPLRWQSSQAELAGAGHCPRHSLSPSWLYIGAQLTSSLLLSSDKCKASAVAEAALEGRPDGADEEGPEESIAQQAKQDDFLDGITQTEGPLALYKQNRLSGRYRRVHPSVHPLTHLLTPQSKQFSRTWWLACSSTWRIPAQYSLMA